MLRTAEEAKLRLLLCATPLEPESAEEMIHLRLGRYTTRWMG